MGKAKNIKNTENTKKTKKNHGKLTSKSLNYTTMPLIAKSRVLDKLQQLEHERNALISQLKAWSGQPALFKDFIRDAEIKQRDNYRTPEQIEKRLITIKRLIHDLKEEYKDQKNPLGHNIVASQSTFPHSHHSDHSDHSHHSHQDISPLSANSRGGKSNRKTKRRKPKRKSIKKK